jgi:hypothetical protein
MNSAQIALHRAIIRQLQAVLGCCKGMLHAWESYLEAQEQRPEIQQRPPQRELTRNSMRQQNWPQ